MSTTTTTTKTQSTKQLQEATLALDNTSKKIRYLVSLGYKDGEIERYFKTWGVTTKAGNPIRYQHIRNTRLMQVATTK